MKTSFFIPLFLLFCLVSFGADRKEVEQGICQAVERPGLEHGVCQMVERPGLNQGVWRMVERSGLEHGVCQVTERKGVEQGICQMVERPVFVQTVSQVVEQPAFVQTVSQVVERPAFVQAVRQAVERQMRRYPQSTLKDLYKNFFQDKYGPGHLIGDTAVAGAYLRQELASYIATPATPTSAVAASREALSEAPSSEKAVSGKTTSATSTPEITVLDPPLTETSSGSQAAFLDSSLYEMAEPTGWEGNFLRVDLSVIQTGQISYALFFDAFLRSVNGITAPPVAEWQKEWNQIEAIIRSMHLALPGYEADRKEIQDRLDRGEYVGHHSQIFENTYTPHYRIIRKDIFEKELKPLLSR